jgi:hypothetical protein
MKVITFGRSSSSDIVINDRLVSRVHCQIIQYDNGSFGIADFGSTNSTYVNGRRIARTKPLNRNDTVRIGNTELRWQSYFGVPQRKNAYTLAWVLGSVGTAVMIALVIGLSVYFNNSGPQHDIIFEGEYPPIETISYMENGGSFDIEAVKGQIIVIFKENISHSQAIERLKQMNGKITGQILDIRYYLVDAGSGNESYFMQQMQNYSDIDFISPNGVSYPCAAVPYVMDNYFISHGNDVTYSLQECGVNIPVKQYNVGDESDSKGRMKWSEIDADLNSILENATEDNSPVINMSFVSGFSGTTVKYWTDATITEKIKDDYRKNYTNELRHLIKIAKKYDDKDFVIIKAAGNNGIKEFDKEILNYLNNNLSDKEKEVLDKHFLLVSAEDTRWSEYSNEISDGVYNSWVTKVDISNLQRNGKDLLGTSFASPRTACFIASVANENKVKVTDALIYAKETTQNNPLHILDKEDLDTNLKKEKAVEKQIINYVNNENHIEQNAETYNIRDIDANTTEITAPSGKTTRYTRNELVGTEWEHFHNNARSGDKTIEVVFIDATNMIIRNFPPPAHVIVSPNDAQQLEKIKKVEVKYVYNDNSKNGYYISSDGDKITFEKSSDKITFYTGSDYMIFYRKGQQRNQPHPKQTSNSPNNLVGTKWESMESSIINPPTTFEFINNENVRITIYRNHLHKDPDIKTVKYFFHKGDEWRFLYSNGDQSPFRINNNILQEYTWHLPGNPVTNEYKRVY